MKILKALIVKEFLQIIRDPSAIMIAFALPLILLFIFGYGVNLDSNRIRVALALENQDPDAMSLAAALTHTRFLDVTIGRDRREFQDELTAGHLRGIIIVPQDFSIKTARENQTAAIQVLADGSEPNIAGFIKNYVRGVLAVWMRHQGENRGLGDIAQGIRVEPRFWYNPELKSRNFLLPGSIAIIMTLIGALLTSLVIAREWERGTMEAMMATPVSITQILLGKLVPYFVLGMGAMLMCVAVVVVFFGVPLRGSLGWLSAVSAIFLLASLGQGLLISSVARNQFVASQLALMSAFLPAFMLSGFIFEISAMPRPIQALTYIFAARYFVSSLQTLFLTGNILPLIGFGMIAIALIAMAFFLLTALKTQKRLDT